MSNRSVMVTLRANVTDFNSNMRKATSSLDELVKKGDATGKVADTGLGRMSQSLELQRGSWDQLGNTMLGVGAAGTVAFGGMAKSAIDYESAFAGVKKTVDGTPEQIDALNESIRNMAREMPASHAEIAGVAEAAGQLGIEIPNIEGFTRSMVALGSSTNMSADEAATSLARFANIMGTSQSEFSNLGSSVVALGNNFATTESEIVTMAQRLASAGNQIGLTEGDVLGIATALSSVGIEAEAGGTAFSTVMIEMRKAVDEGGSSLDMFAQTAGMTGSQFQKAFKEDAAGAITAFIQGLAQMEASGQSMQPILDELGLTDQRVGNALRSSAAAADLFTGAIEMGNQAYGENTALMAEYEQRVGTTESQLQIFKNTVVDAAISFGELLLPVITAIIGPLGDFAGWIADLPEPIKYVVMGLGGLATAGALSLGMFLKLTPMVYDSVKAFRELKGMNIPVISRSLQAFSSTIGAYAGPLGLGVTALTAFGIAIGAVESGKNKRAKAFVEELSSAYTELGDAADKTARQMILQEIIDDGTADKLDAAGISISRYVDAVMLVPGAYESIAGELDGPLLMRMLELNGALEAGREAGDQYARGFEGIPGIMSTLGGALGTALGQLTTFSSGVSESSDVAQESLDEMFETIATSDANFISLKGAYDSVIGKNKEWAESTASATASSKDSWEDYYDGVSFKMDDYLAALEEQVAAQEEWEKNMLLLSGKVSQGVLDELARLGPEGAPLVAGLVDASQEQLDIMEEAFGNGGSNAASAYATGLQNAGPVMAEVMRVAGEDAYNAAAEALYSGEKTLQDVIDEYDLDIEVDTDAANLSLDGLQANLLETPEEIRTQMMLMKEKASARYNEYRGLLDGNPKTSETEAIFQRDKASEKINQHKKMISGIKSTADTVAGFFDSKARMSIGQYINYLDRLNGKTVNTYVNVIQSGVGAAVNLLRRASGGSIFGPGTETSDSIPILASHNEHMWSAREVKGAGGHGAMELMRAMAREGSLIPMLHAFTGAERHAYGGPVGAVAPPAVIVPSQQARAMMVSMPRMALTAYITNPWTGEELLTRARVVADEQAREWVEV